MPTVSVIVPVYNAEKSLHRCIDSILDQTLTDFEVLLIDDGSKDNSLAICNEYAIKDSGVRSFHKENGGVSSARNYGLDYAKSRWVTFADADDWVGEEWLSIFWSGIEAGADLVVQGFDYCYERHYEKMVHVGFSYKGSIYNGIDRLYQNVMPGAVWNKMFSYSLIKEYQLRFNEEFSFKEDEDFVMRYVKKCSLVYSEANGCYKYDMPDWSSKYTHNLEACFACNCSIVKSMLDIIDNGVLLSSCLSYLKIICNDYFYLISCKKSKSIELTKEFLSLVHLVENRDMPLSGVTIFFLKVVRNPRIVALLMFVKTRVHSAL